MGEQPLHKGVGTQRRCVLLLGSLSLLDEGLDKINFH